MSSIATHSGNERQVVEYIQIAGDRILWENHKEDAYGHTRTRTLASFEEVRADIQKKINEKLSEGYSLYGNLEYNVVMQETTKLKYNIFEGKATHYMIQAMVKYA